MNPLINKYPWLHLKDPYAEPDEEPTTFLDFLPRGWVKTFGAELCEDLDMAIKRAGIESEFKVDEAKEKYGALSLCFGPTSKEVDDVERAYRAISETVCCNCGTIHGVKMITRRWVSPYCRKCYAKTTQTPDYDYFDSLPTEELPTVVKWRQFGNEQTKHFELDISETTKKIRENWEKKNKESQFAEWEDNYNGA